MQQPAGREAVAQPPDQLVGALALRRAERVGIPFRGLIIVDRDEGRLAAHCQTHVVRREIGVDLLAERIERGPGFVGKRNRDARLLVDARHRHSKAKATSAGSTSR